LRSALLPTPRSNRIRSAAGSARSIRSRTRTRPDRDGRTQRESSSSWEIAGSAGCSGPRGWDAGGGGDGGGVVATGAWTTSSAVAVLPAPPFADRTASVVAVRSPGSGALTSTEKVQLPFTAMLPSASDTTRDPGTAVIMPPLQFPSSPFGDATASPAGSVVASATPVSGTVFADGFVIVNANVDDSPAVIVAGANEAEALGGATTASAPSGSPQAVAAGACRLSPP